MASKLYLISPPQINLSQFVEQFKSAISGGEIGAFQLRLKDIPDAEILKAGEVLMPLALDNNIPFVINDSAQITKSLGATGVHLGSDDSEITEARNFLGGNFIIGASCYNSIDLAINATSASADYVSFGAFFPTTTKVPKSKAEIETLKKWHIATQIPVCAIGGITPQNCKSLVQAGANFICAISYVWNHPISPQKAVEEFNEKFKDPN